MAKNYPKESVIEKAIVTHADVGGGGFHAGSGTIREETEKNIVTDLLSGRKSMFEQLTIYENMFSTYMSGAIFLTDVEAKGIRNSFSPGDTLTLSIRKNKRKNADPDDVEVGLAERTFSIYRVESIAPTENANTKSYVLHFASPSYVVLNQIADDHIFQEYIGRISKDELSQDTKFTSSYLDMNDNPIGNEESEYKAKNDDCDLENYAEQSGLVNSIVKNYLSKTDGVAGTPVPYEIEESHNSIWYRQFFPVVSAKLDDYRAESLYNILQECEDYAQNVKNPKAVNFYFWQDFDGIHFRSVESLIESQEYDEFPADKIYSFSPDINQQSASTKHNRVNELEVYNYVDLVELLTNGSLSSIYRYWLNPRQDLVNMTTFNENEINFEMSREEINFLIDRSTYVYYYPRDWDEWKTIEEEPLISNVSDEHESKLLTPTLRNALRPQMITEPLDYQHGFNILDRSPATSFYNHYKHTRLDICKLKDYLFIQNAITRPMKAFYEMLNRHRQYDFDKKLKDSGCTEGAAFSFNFGYDPEQPFQESFGIEGDAGDYTSKYLGYDNEKVRKTQGSTKKERVTTKDDDGNEVVEEQTVPDYDWYAKPSCTQLGQIAASIPEECSLIENIFGPEWLGCGTRDHWYYGSLHRSTPTARFKEHTNAELSYFRDVCGSDSDFTDLLGVGGDSIALDWKRTFPGLFSEGPDCTCPCQCGNAGTDDDDEKPAEKGKNFRLYQEYSKTFSRFWNTDNWVPLLRNAQENLLKSQQLIITTSGNMFRKPGEIILLDVPTQSALADAGSDPTQEFMRGKYMITSIKHSISANNTHTMEMELSRDSFPEPYASVGKNMLVNYDELLSGSFFNEATTFPLESEEIEYTRDIDTPGFLRADKYRFFGPTQMFDSGMVNFSAGTYTYPTGKIHESGDKKGEPITNTIKFVNDQQKSISAQFKDDPSIGLQFTAPFINSGWHKDFTSYDWVGYANASGYLTGNFNPGEEEEESPTEES